MAETFKEAWNRLYDKAATTPIAGNLSARDMYNGVKEAVVDPIKEDFKDAYWIQRAAREKYPAADAALNFIPTPLGAVVGLAANADDLYHDAGKGDLIKSTGDVGGALLGTGRIASAGKLLKSTMSDGKYAIDAVQKKLGTKAGAPEAAFAANFGVIPAGAVYAADVADSQRDANKEYKDQSVADLAKQLRAESEGRKEFSKEFNKPSVQTEEDEDE
jgi:hypothetical protein